jgi:hypothetical protein
MFFASWALGQDILNSVQARASQLSTGKWEMMSRATPSGIPTQAIFGTGVTKLL